MATGEGGEEKSTGEEKPTPKRRGWLGWTMARKNT